MSQPTSPDLTGSPRLVTVKAVDAGEMSEFPDCGAGRGGGGDFKLTLSTR